jgi:outer membrane protein
MMNVRFRRIWLWLAFAGVMGLVGSGAAQEQAAEAPEQPAGQVPVFDLEQCIRMALESSNSLAIAQAQHDQAAQEVKRAFGAFLPDLSLSRTDVRDERTEYDTEIMNPALVPVVDTGGDTIFFGGSIGTGRFEDTRYKTRYNEWQAQSNLNLFAGGSKFSSLSGAKNSLKSAEAQALYLEKVVVQDVASAYYDLLRYERLLEVAHETRDLAAKELERSETYFKLGSAAKSDVLQARVRLENTRLDVVRAENAVAQAFAALAYAMNQPLAAPFEIDRSPLETDFQIAEIEDLYSQALRNRLDLKSQEHLVASRRNAVTTATSSLWPRLDLFAQYSRSNNENALYRFGAQQSGLLRYGYQVTWNVFDRLGTWTNRAQAKADARIAEYNLDQARLDAQLEIRQLYNNLVEARERVSVSRETIIQAQEELRLAQERFRVGAGTTLDRINAEVNLAQARADEVQAICDFLINSVKLDRAVGRLSGDAEPQS